MSTGDLPRVAVVVAAYNAERHLACALRSALAQHLAPSEVIVVDDGSRDRTGEVAAAFGAPVRVVRQENRGPGAARNRGVREARADLVAFLDADDELLPPMTATLSRALAEHSDAAVASGAHLLDDDGAMSRSPREGRVGRSRTVVLGDFFEVARRHHVACVGATLVRREEFLRVGGFREDVRFGEDLDLWARLGGSRAWVYVDEPVMLYHYSRGVSTTRVTPEAVKPADFMLDEQRLAAAVRPALRESYRRYRRDMLLRQARAALAQRATSQARSLLAAIAPAPPSLAWCGTALLARAQPFASALLGTVAFARHARRAIRGVFPEAEP